MRVGIVGAGIAGLTAALALARHGFASTILEAAPHLESIGAGIQLAPNATRLLDRLGVLNAVRANACEPEALRLRDGHDGRLLATVPLGRAMRVRHGSPYLTLRRADLQSALAAGVQCARNIEIRLGTSVTNVEQANRAVRVAAGSPALDFDLLLAADGVRSWIRTDVLNLSGAVGIGRTAWRTTLPSADLPTALRSDITVFLAPRAHAVLYPVRTGLDTNVVVVAEENRREAEPPLPFAGTLGRLDVPWTRWPLMVSDPRVPWVQGRIALIGDAAHAMAPSAAQGAAQAIEDSVTLADALARDGQDSERALSAWQRSRQPRVSRVSREADRNLRIYEMRGLAASARDFALGCMSERFHLKRLDWIYRDNQ